MTVTCISLSMSDRRPNPHLEIDTIIYQLIQELGGSVSAEHGIGLMKKPFLAHSQVKQKLP